MSKTSQAAFPYFMQCDKWRRLGDKEEQAWHEMIRNKQAISQEGFVDRVEINHLLEEGESLDEYVADDPEHGFYLSAVNGMPVYFLQHSGFEFIFTPKGNNPCDL